MTTLPIYDSAAEARREYRRLATLEEDLKQVILDSDDAATLRDAQAALERGRVAKAEIARGFFCDSGVKTPLTSEVRA
jgi:hypothetical protein